MIDALIALPSYTDRLLATVATLEDSTSDSLCDGWTRGHILTHIARNAEAIGRLASWAVTGEPQKMYPGGTEGRNAAVEAGAGRDLEALRADVAETATALAPLLDRLKTDTVVDQVELRGGALASPSILPWMRLREVVFHHIDLDAGFTFEDVEPALVQDFLEDAVDRLQDHPKAPGVTIESDDGDRWVIGDGAARVNGSRTGLLLWLARRIPTGVSGDPIPALPRGG